jgi:hypothetical protein
LPLDCAAAFFVPNARDLLNFAPWDARAHLTWECSPAQVHHLFSL